MACTEARRSAWARLARHAPALLAGAKERAEGQVPTLDGLERVPGDPHRRARLAPVSPQGLRPVGTRRWRPRQRGKAREPLGCLAGPAVRARAGPASVTSQTLPGASCRHRVPRTGAIPSAQQRWGAGCLPPDPRAVLARRPAPLGHGAGTDKQEGARQAAQRWVARRRQAHPPCTGRGPAARRRAPAPDLEPLPDHALRALLGGKAGEQASVVPQGKAAEPAGRGPAEARPERAAGRGPRWRCVHSIGKFIFYH